MSPFILLLSMLTLNFDFYLQPKQKELVRLIDETPLSVVGYGGSRGGAKSHGGREAMLIRRFKYKGTSGLILRKTLDDLRDNHIRPMFKQYPQLEQFYRKQEKILDLPGGSHIRFISSDNYDDIFKLIGKEFADIFVDQSEQFSQEQLEFLFTVNRSADDITPKMWWTFNPGNIGHGYHKRIFIEKDFLPNENPESFGFIRAYGWDNAEWVRKALKSDGLTVSEFNSWDSDRRFQYFVTRSDYGIKLDRLADSQRKAQLLGDFDVFEGQFFSDFRRELHVIKPIELVGGWSVVGGLDYGQQTVLELLVQDFEGRVINFGEVVTEYQSPTDRANAIAEYLLERKIHNLRMVYDTNMDVSDWQYTDNRTPAQTFQTVFKQVMGEKAPYMMPVSKKPVQNKNYRAATNESVKEYLSWLKNDDGTYKRRPRLYVTENCRVLLKTMPLLLHDPESPEGLDFIQGKDVYDHAYDAMKYGFMSLYRPVAREEAPKPYADAGEYIQHNVIKAMQDKSRNRTVANLR